MRYDKEKNVVDDDWSSKRNQDFRLEHSYSFVRRSIWLADKMSTQIDSTNRRIIAHICCNQMNRIVFELFLILFNFYHPIIHIWGEHGLEADCPFDRILHIFDFFLFVFCVKWQQVSICSHMSRDHTRFLFVLSIKIVKFLA